MSAPANLASAEGQKARSQESTLKQRHHQKPTALNLYGHEQGLLPLSYVDAVGDQLVQVGFFERYLLSCSIKLFQKQTFKDQLKVHAFPICTPMPRQLN